MERRFLFTGHTHQRWGSQEFKRIVSVVRSRVGETQRRAANSSRRDGFRCQSMLLAAGTEKKRKNGDVEWPVPEASMQDMGTSYMLHAGTRREREQLKVL